MWQQKENLFSDRFVVHTWLKRATVYSHVSLLEENVHMAWTRFSSGLANQKRATLSSPQGQKAVLLLRIHRLTCRKILSSLCKQGSPCKPHQWVECRTSRTDAGGHHGGVLRASSSSALFGDFCPWHHSKWNLLDACHLLLLLLLAEMQWWMSTLRKDLCLHNYGIQLSCRVWWCQALSYHLWSHTEMKICSANNFKQIKCYFSSYLGSVQVQSNNVCLFPVQTDDAECLPAAPQSLGMAAACTYHALIDCCSSDGPHL